MHPIFIAALFIIGRAWKQPKCTSTEEWIKKMWQTYTMEYDSAIKKERNCVICRDTDGSRNCHTECSKSEREKQTSYVNTYHILTHICAVQKNGIDNITCKTEIETQM